MAQPTPDMLQLARLAAERVEAELIAMMLANELGEVAAILGHNDLLVEGRPRQKLLHRKLERGRWALIERVVQT